MVTRRHVSVSTQKQALSALIFLYRTVLGREQFSIDDWSRSRRPKKLPVVFSKAEADQVIGQLEWSFTYRSVADVWLRAAVDGSNAPEGEGCGLRP